MENVLKGAALGAATGGVAHVTGNVVNQVDPGIARSLTKVVADTIGLVAIDASYQLIVDGEVDAKKLAFNAGDSAATSWIIRSRLQRHIRGSRRQAGGQENLDELDHNDRKGSHGQK